MKKFDSKLKQTKCFTDECEWRFVPDVTQIGFPQALYNEKVIANAGLFDSLNNSISGLPEVSLKFEYKDIKHIIVKNRSDFYEFVSEIKKLSTIDDIVKYELISKIIIWEDSRGDF